MVKLVYCLRRLPHLTREEFQQYWRDKHAPLVAERASVLGIRRYVQCHTLDAGSHAPFAEARGGLEPYDGVAELWFDSPEAVSAGRSSPEAKQAARDLLEDEKRFIDFSSSPLMMTVENAVLSGDDPEQMAGP